MSIGKISIGRSTPYAGTAVMSSSKFGQRTDRKNAGWFF